MPSFGATIDAAVAGRTVRAGALLFFDFLSAPWRIWPGAGDVVTGGQTYVGKNTLIVLDLGAFSIDGAAEQFSAGINGVDTRVSAAVVAGETEAIGRNLTIMFQFFDENWAPLDGPLVVRKGRIRGYDVSGSGPSVRNIQVNCESIFGGRGNASMTMLSDREQQLRFSGDHGLDRMTINVNHTVTWPK